jgi:hypothetical protein
MTKTFTPKITHESISKIKFKKKTTTTTKTQLKM